MEAEQLTRTAVLRHADRRLRMTAANEVHEICSIARRAAESLGPVETFYVGVYRGEDILVMPYIHNEGVDLGADTSRYRVGGLCHHIRRTGSRYRLAQDGGRLCRTSVPLGDGQPSGDIVAVPIFDEDGRTVLGLLNAQAREADAFDDDFIRALEWLAQALAVSLALGSFGSGRSMLYQGHPELDSRQLRTPVDLLNAITERLEVVVSHVDALRAGQTNEAAAMDMALIIEKCRSATADLALMTVNTPDATRPDPAARLTGREREIAELIGQQGMSNAEIASTLVISGKTVKAHVGSILRKLGLQQRGELAWALGERDSVAHEVAACASATAS